MPAGGMCGIEIVMAERPEPDPPDGLLETLTAERDAWAQAAFESQRFAAQIAIERQHLSDAIDGIKLQAREAARSAAASESEAVLAALRGERDQALAERDAIAAERDRAIAQRDRARADAHDSGAMLERVTSSRAWRLTGPARRMMQAVLRR